MLAALTAYGALGGVRAWLRAPAAALAALPYLAAAYLAQGAFKEPMLALALVGFALSLPALRECWRGYSPTIAATFDDRGRRWMRSQALLALPGGVIAAGTIYNYSFPGLAWLALAAIAWALITAWHERGRREGMHLRDRVKWATPVIVAGVAIPVIAALPELIRIVSFAGFEAFSPSGAEGNTGYGNLRQALNPLQSLGVWPSSEFRLSASNAGTPAVAFYAGALLAAVALAWGLGRAWSRREAALPAAFAAGAAGYLVALAVGHPVHVGEGAGGPRAGRDADRPARRPRRPTASRTRARARPTGGRPACCARSSSSASRRSRWPSSARPRSRPCCRCASPRSGPWTSPTA